VAKAYNDHNVYIVGAGFGAEAGLPVIKDFMNRMRDAGAWLEGRAGRDEQEAISRVLEFRLRAAAAANRVPLNVENIEELFSLASASGDEELAAKMPLAIAVTLDYAQQVAKPPAEWQRFQIGIVNQPGWTRPPTWNEPLPYVQEGMKRGDRKGSWYSCPPYDFYAGVMAGYFNKGGPDRRDTIVTFNYDLLLEESCRNLGIPFSYGFQVSRDESAQDFVTFTNDVRVQILKLHGSMNWVNFAEHLFSPQEKARRRQPFVPGQEEDWERTEGWPGPRVFENYSELRRKGFNPLLLPPTWRKDLGTDQYSRMDFSNVWDAAVAALRTATNVIILVTQRRAPISTSGICLPLAFRTTSLCAKSFSSIRLSATKRRPRCSRPGCLAPAACSVPSCESKASSSSCQSTRANFLPDHTISMGENHTAYALAGRLIRGVAPPKMHHSGFPTARRTSELGGEFRPDFTSQFAARGQIEGATHYPLYTGSDRVLSCALWS